MDIQALLGARALGEDKTENYIHWAEQQLLRGDDSDNIAILAGLGLDKLIDREEVLFYFQRCLNDKGIELGSRQEQINTFIKYLCQQIIDDAENVYQYSHTLAQIHFSHTIDGDLLPIWGELNDDLCMLDSDDPYFWNPELTRENQREFIGQVAQQFLRLMERDIPHDFLSYYWCQSCQQLTRPEWVNKPAGSFKELMATLTGKRQPVKEPICLRCHSKTVTSIRLWQGRELWLNKQ